MPLEIRHNRAEHTHENEQFRRVATMLRSLFEQNSWDGLLIGNPFNEDFGRFRADAILLYDHGLVVIDFKDYRGTIILPQNEDTFKSSMWYTENPANKGTVEIKGGVFINPFRQLQAYRGVMYEVVDQNIYLKGLIDPSKVLALNIFSGPIDIKNRVPGSLPYYKITQESDLPTFLYDFSSVNKHCSESAKAFIAIFNAEIWHEHVEILVAEQKEVKPLEIASDVEKEVLTFLKQDTSGVLVLESMHNSTRDNWMRFILSEAPENNVTQTEAWCHSGRIASKAGRRSGISLQGLYSTLYGGNQAKPQETDESEHAAEEDADTETQIRQIVPIRSDNSLDEAAVIVLHEAHLVTRSLHQSEVLRFGTGRLLEDLFSFLQLDTTKRKLICIGDPYSLTYGKASENALSLEILHDLFKGQVLHYREPVLQEFVKGYGRLRNNLAKHIDNNQFNCLSYPWLEQNLVDVNKEQIGKLLKNWFTSPCGAEPQFAALTYTNKNAKDINAWVKKECIKTGENLSRGDLLLLNNNIKIPDETGYGQPTRLYNGMYLLVDEVKGSVPKMIAPSGGKPVTLNFVELSVRCLSLTNNIQTTIWILDNYFNSEDGLSREELIAFRVFVNMTLGVLTKKKPFNESFFHRDMLQSAEYKQAKNKIDDLAKRLSEDEKVKVKLKEAESKLSKIEKSYKNKQKQTLVSEVLSTDPLVNAAHVSYGWALTVHKAIGSTFTSTILNASDGCSSRGIMNLEYYRWLYSALTSTEQISYVANPRTIHPLMDCKFVDESEVVLNSESANKKPLIYSGYVPAETYSHKFPGTLNENVVGTICEFAKIVEKDGFVLNDVRCSNKYLTKMHFECPESDKTQLTLAINNKGVKDNWTVTSVRIEKAEGTDKSTVNKYIEKLFEESASVGQNLLDDFRGDIYRELEKAFKTDNYSFALLDSSKDWQDIFEIKDASSFARIRFWYDGKGFFTKAVLFEKTDDIIAAKISEVLSKWNQSSS